MTTTQITFSIPTNSTVFNIELKPRSVTTFVGANGAGKTRLGVHIEQQIPTAHRIAAQKSLTLESKVQSTD